MAPVVPSKYATMDRSKRRRARVPQVRVQIEKLPSYSRSKYKWHELWDSMNDRVVGIATKIDGVQYKVEHSFYIGAHTLTRDNTRIDHRGGTREAMVKLAEGFIANQGPRPKKTAAPAKTGSAALRAAIRRDK